MTDKKTKSLNHNLKDYTLISLFSAIIAIFSFLNIPATIPFTLQTLGIFLSLTVLGGKRGTKAVILYIVLGIIGLPVFSGFNGGLSHLLSATGGYILGFIPLSLIYYLFEKISGKCFRAQIIGLVTGLTACYITGALWFNFMYLKAYSFSAFLLSLSASVLPFVIPDIVKIAVALLLSKKLKHFNVLKDI